MEMSLNLRDFAFLLAQAVMVTTVIVTNKQSITHLKTQQESLKEWLEALQNELKELRIKLGK
ncbi:hypothetical protein L3V43_20565 [Pseudoalteromonas sp. L23]|uniref:hypothetical protein n=1 Tax=unclassified Pseudoalteromonas TaxID=194690 RepID=UPI001EF01549|nr:MULTISPECIES: hypothetical protein [unclassified Pseudoalteromonas]MCF7515982.1 hypothetical protein [Pseudoalteromonas sp. L7]MCF7528046.1 hypothetical protein [Pseudoalteromonas sp. L23]MCG7553106.1 hypothetical protein [Pseudoalteromonas sp. Of11M-6]